MSFSGKSKYFEIKEMIEARIQNNEYPVGSQLPSEPKLAEMYNASRGTIRQALSALERQGVIARRSGVGTLVVRSPKQSSIISFTQQVIDKGKKPSTRVLSKQILPLDQAGGRAVAAFSDTPGASEAEQVLFIERLRLADGEPVAKQEIYLRAADFGSKLLEEQDFSASIMKIYERFRRYPAWADEIIQARRPTSAEVQLFQMQTIPEVDRLVYVRDRITYDSQNLPLEVLVSIERADFFGTYQYRLLTN